MSMNIDILPTVADITGGGNTPMPLDGRSLAGLLREGKPSARDPLLFFQGEEVVAIRDEQWKLVTHAWFRRTLVDFEKLDRVDGFQEPYTLLFDMKNDPDERYSVADRHPEIVTHLQKALAAARAEFEPLRAEPPQKTFPD
jgi:arylsulfatase A-like enzyme